MNRAWRCLLALLALSARFTAASAANAPALKAGVFSPPRQAPDFSLQGSDGRELKLSSYRGKVVVLGFGFTSCPDVCPTTLGTLAQARRNLGAQAANVQVIYVTVDPERDVADTMKKYLGAFDPDIHRRHWHRRAALRRPQGLWRHCRKEDIRRRLYLRAFLLHISHRPQRQDFAR